ncbi:MAG: bifunctional riboflavin kinase/FAD synthetase [Candidatus Omnitrophica bacterium]|nr:bifunctional riboflavin kinase/FAD synthetase [Candidatus Omnitrophota bacterium]
MIILHRMPRTPGRRAAVATVGVFDGVHRAHQRILRTTVARARVLRLTSCAVTFDPHPQQILRPDRPMPLLMTLAQRLEWMAACGIATTIVIPFTRTFAKLTPERFVTDMLVRRLGVRELIVGERFVFGQARRGNTRLLRRLAGALGLTVRAVRPVQEGGEAISSSRIRTAIGRGDVASATRWLGHPVTLTGTVVRGAARGRQWGVPTANLHVEDLALPGRGVYAVRVRLRHRWYAGVMNIGTRPTLRHGLPLTIEVHLLQFHGTLYGERPEVWVVERLRDERRFASLERLRAQLGRDVARAKQRLQLAPPLPAV